MSSGADEQLEHPREALREKLAADLRDFRRRGGKIEKLRPGESGEIERGGTLKRYRQRRRRKNNVSYKARR